MTKTIIPALVSILFSCSMLNAQATYEATEHLSSEEKIGKNGFSFELLTTGINSENADYGAGLFRNKFISFSAKKIGAFAKKDKHTEEPFTKLYCNDILGDNDLDRPLLFSRILNKNENLGSVAFSEDGNTIYFTKSNAENTTEFQLYKAVMNPKKLGEWINSERLPFNIGGYSFENPCLNKTGTKLLFSSNMPLTKGGFDIFEVAVLDDGSYGPVRPVFGKVNTTEDEKFPQFSIDEKFLFFSSKGHPGVGGFDAFKSRRTKSGYNTIVNLGTSINSSSDEIAFVPATETIGYITSNRTDGYGNYDIYRITEYVIDQRVTGTAIDSENGNPLSDVTVQLIDTDGTLVAEIKTDATGAFDLSISSFEYYTVVGSKEGFYPGSTIFNTDNKTDVYNADIKLTLNRGANSN